jgi:hypothetical protein
MNIIFPCAEHYPLVLPEGSAILNLSGCRSTNKSNLIRPDVLRRYSIERPVPDIALHRQILLTHIGYSFESSRTPANRASQFAK